MSGRLKVGLALGSGSARGLAHIGVLQALEENGIAIDCIAGCSMGAIIGSIYASGTNLELLKKLCIEMNSKDLLDITVPRKGLIKGIRFEKLIKLLTKDMDFDQLKIPFACVACDIREGKTVTFTKGKVYRAVRASMSIPAVFEPCFIDGVMYVDGGVLDAVPVDAARQLGAQMVIAVDVGYKGGTEDIRENFWDVLMRTLDLMGWEASRRKTVTADILIQPLVRHTAKYSNSDAKKCIQIGYDTAMEHMSIIKAKIQEMTEALETTRQ